MLRKLPFLPGTYAIILVWIAIWVLVTTCDCVSVLEGKGISKVGTEYYRFLTAGLTHTNFIHLLANVAAMFWIGFLYEEKLGTVKFLTIGIVCAVVSQIIFLYIYRNAEGSIGGSLYNFALCGFGLTLQFLVPGFPRIVLGTWSGNWLAINLIVSNIPILSFMNATTLITHAIAFAVGIIAALICWLLGLR